MFNPLKRDIGHAPDRRSGGKDRDQEFNLLQFIRWKKAKSHQTLSEDYPERFEIPGHISRLSSQVRQILWRMDR